MHRWIAIVTCVCACTRPADREAAEKAAADKAIADKVDKANAEKAGTEKAIADKANDAAVEAPDAAAPTISPTVPTVPTVSTAPTAKLEASDSKITQVEMDRRSTCARRADGGLRCWGSATAREIGSVVPYTIEGVPEAASFHLAHGVLAVATRSGDVAIGPLAVPEQPKLELVSVGEAIDVRVDSRERAWALTRSGEVHRIEGTTAERKLVNVIALSSREKDSLDALHRDGTVTTVTDGKAIPIKGLVDAEWLFGSHCAHRKSGGVTCWDTRGKTFAWKGPLNVVDRRNSAGNTCTLAGSGVACVGRNDAGQLGTGPGDDVTARDVAKIVPLPGKPASIAGGDRAWCAVLDSGALACWGANDGGQLGDGTLIDRFTPVVIAGASSASPPVAPKRGDEPVAEADVEMGWNDLPKGCTKPTTIPRPGGEPVTVTSAYAITRDGGAELWFADFKIVAGGYRKGHVVARGKQMAVVYTLEGKKVARGRYRGSKGTVALATLGATAPSPADVLVEKVDGGWICGTILDPDDAKKRAPFAAKITKPRYGD
jgi:hypothetical protein